MPVWLQTLLLVLAVAWSSIALFGDAGIGVLLLVLTVAAILYKKENPLALVFLLLLGIFVLFLLVPSVQTARESGSRAQCMNNLHQIGLAVLQYESEYRCFLPPYIPDKNGKPMHSWRVLILPYLEQKGLYKQYDFSEPWDGPHNRRLLVQRPKEFACPGDEGAWEGGATTTSYVAVVGKNAMWRTDKPTSLSDAALEGKASNSVMLIEVADSGINWTEPKDFSLDESAAKGQPPSRLRRSIGHFSAPAVFLFRPATSATTMGAIISFADGHQEFLPAAAIASEKLNDWLTIGGFNDDKIGSPPPGRQIELLPQHRSERINWANCFALAIWIVSVVLLFVRAWRSRRLALIDGPADETPVPESRVAGDRPESTNDRIAGS